MSKSPPYSNLHPHTSYPLAIYSFYFVWTSSVKKEENSKIISFYLISFIISQGTKKKKNSYKTK